MDEKQLEKTLDWLCEAFDDLDDDLSKVHINTWERLAHAAYWVLKVTGRYE